MLQSDVSDYLPHTVCVLLRDHRLLNAALICFICSVFFESPKLIFVLAGGVELYVECKSYKIHSFSQRIPKKKADFNFDYL